MHVVEYYKSDPFTISIEVYPPRKNLKGVLNAINSLGENIVKPEHKPRFVNVTCPSGRNLYSQPTDSESVPYGIIPTVLEIQRSCGLTVVPHITAEGKSKLDIQNLLLHMYFNIGIENVLAVRGDPSKGQDFIPHKDGHTYGSELVEQIRSLNKGLYLTDDGLKQGMATNLSTAVSCYPEGHPKSLNKEDDLMYLRKKLEHANYAVSQVFCDVNHFLEFLDRAKEIGISKPLIPGIMPVENFSEIERYWQHLGIDIPESFRNRIKECKGDAVAERKVCLDHVLGMCRTLKEEGIPGIHFYIMDRRMPTLEIIRNL